MIVTNIRGLGATGYVPNCSGTYNPCLEIQKAKANNITPTASLIEKCKQYGQACFPGTGAYVPNCAGTYDPTAEIDKAYANGLTPSSSLLAKGALWVETCGSGSAIAPAVSATAVSAQTAKAGIVAALPALRLSQPQTHQAMPNYGGGAPAGPTTESPPQADEGYIHEALPNPDIISTPSWLSENKGTVALGIVAVIGAIVLIKAL